MDLYEWFIVAILVLWMFSAPQDRNALRIVLIASLFSETIVGVVTRQIHGAWKLAIPGAVEILTIMALLQWGRNRTAYIQAALLIVAWLAHVFCYLDIKLGSDFVYSRYEGIIYAVALGQILACHDTIAHCFRSVRNWLWSVGRGGVRFGSRRAALLHPPSGSGV